MPHSNRTICLVPQKLGLGGPASFQARLIAGLTQRGVEISVDPLDPANSAVLVIGGTRKLRRAVAGKTQGDQDRPAPEWDELGSPQTLYWH